MLPFESIELSDFEQVEKAVCEASLMSFMEVFWPVVNGSPFKSGWHMEAICEHLEAVSDSEIRRLAINGPPRSSKSTPASVFWPVWDWISPRKKNRFYSHLYEGKGTGQTPYRTWLTAGNTQRLAVGFNYFSRAIIRSDKFQRYWGNVFQLALDNDLKTQFSNNCGGQRLAVGAKTKFIGSGGEMKVLDDPHMPTDSPKSMEEMCDWYFQTWRTRTNNHATACEIVVMQRLSVYDLCEAIKFHEKGAWDFLVLPSRFNPSKLYTTSLGFKDPRTEENELLWPQQIPDEEEKFLRASLKERADAQMDQDPVNIDEVLYKPQFLKNRFDRIIYNRDTDIICTTTDTGIKSTEVADFSACGLGLKKGHNFFFLGGFAQKVEFNELVELYLELLGKWQKRGLKFYKHLIEDSSNGPALFAIAGKRFSRLELIKAPRTNSKMGRLKQVVPIYSANRVWFPVPGATIEIDGISYPLDDLECLAEWLTQTGKVPAGKDDCPDAWAQLLNEIGDLSFLDAEDYEEDDDNNEESRFFFLDEDF